ncbi:MAG: J domain-containing protein [bacterium]|nr:J domain-containing protein [bacterium]
MMRYYTYSVGAQLVHELVVTRAVREILHDGSDLIHVLLPEGEQVMIYLIERPLPTYELKLILEQNTAAGYYTMFLLWSEMLLPDDGALFEPDEWMESLLTLYGNHIYGYEIYMGRLLLVPVHFEHLPNSYRRIIRHDDPLDVRTLHCMEVETPRPGLRGAWRVASFSRVYRANARSGDHASAHGSTYRSTKTDRAAALYAVLGLSPGADRVSVKRAYRDLARQHHPDLSRDRDATRRMQQINVAYDTIMDALDEEEGV